MPAKPEQPMMEAILDVLNSGYEIAHLAENPRRLIRGGRLSFASGFRAKLDTLGALYEEAKPKPRPKLRRTTCGKAPEYFEEEHGTTILCPDPECE